MIGGADRIGGSEGPQGRPHNDSTRHPARDRPIWMIHITDRTAKVYHIRTWVLRRQLFCLHPVLPTPAPLIFAFRTCPVAQRLHWPLRTMVTLAMPVRLARVGVVLLRWTPRPRPGLAAPHIDIRISYLLLYHSTTGRLAWLVSRRARLAAAI